MLEPGGVFPSAGQQHHRGLVGGMRRRRRAQRLEQHLRCPVGVLDRGGRLQLGKVLAQQPAVDDRVRGARRHPQIVFQHQPMAGAVAHQVGAADVCAHRIAGEAARRAEAGRPVEGLHTDDAVGDDRLLGIDVAQERIQRPGPLTQAVGQMRPLAGGHQPRHQIEREQLGAALAGHPEGDVVGALLLLDVCFPGPQLRHSEAGDGVQDRPIARPWATVGVDGLVIADVGVATGDGDAGSLPGW